MIAFVLVSPYALLGIIAAIACAAWASWVAAGRYSYLDRDVRREVILGLIVISLLTGIGGVLAAYLSKADAPVIQ
jgi:hypothetical protein